jgi:hypothetical protein
MSSTHPIVPGLVPPILSQQALDDAREFEEKTSKDAFVLRKKRLKKRLRGIYFTQKFLKSFM